MTRKKSVWFKAGTKLAWDVHMRRAKKGKLFATPDSDQMCHQCIVKDWAPPAVLLYAYTNTDQSQCSRCGNKIEPADGVKRALAKKAASRRQGGLTLAEHRAWARQKALEERARNLHLRGLRTEYEILGSSDDADHDT